MTQQAQAEKVVEFSVPPVVKTVLVKCAPAKAFRVFTENVADWWPLAHFHAGDEAVTCAFEGKVGGRLFERARSGAETAWGRVLAWEPPRRLAFTWTVQLSDEQAQHIEVTFTPAAGGTEVRLVHSGWEKLGTREAAEKARGMFDGGWVLVFEQRFKDYANSVA